MSIAIKFENISKQYRLGNVGTGTISHDLNRWWAMNIRGKEDPYLKIGSVNERSTKADSDYVWALRDINFEVQQGEVLGIIGKNGAGKSTLLKILSRVTSPTTGEINARGRIASLLEVGTGFHPEMTGRENIFMNGAIMGMTKAEIRRKMDEIVDFSGCERYIDTPVKRYSSGMTVRLGFAVAAHLEPEILVVDEVLAVGDAEFQKKAIGKMQDISKGEGRTVLFVSHNMASMQQLCKKGLLLENGKVKEMGNMKSVISLYQQMISYTQELEIHQRVDRQGSGQIRLISCEIKNSKSYVISSIILGDAFILELKLKKIDKSLICENLIVSVGFNNEYGERIIVISNIYTNDKIDMNEDLITLRFKVERCQLNVGKYGLAFFIADGNCIFDWIDSASYIIVEEGDFYNTGKVNSKDSGLFLINYEIEQV